MKRAHLITYIILIIVALVFTFIYFGKDVAYMNILGGLASLYISGISFYYIVSIKEYRIKSVDRSHVLKRLKLITKYPLSSTPFESEQKEMINATIEDISRMDLDNKSISRYVKRIKNNLAKEHYSRGIILEDVRSIIDHLGL